MCSLPEIKTILLTGGIGSGKSTAAAVLLSKGIPVYDADSRAKALYTRANGLVPALESRLGIPLRNESGEFQKQLLAAVLFGPEGKEAIAAVEEMLFPYLIEDFERFAGEAAQDKFRQGADPEKPVYVAMESATALEKEAFKDFGDIRLVVDAPYEMRLERACRRDGADRTAVEGRMAQQPLMNRISGGERPEGIDAVLVNDGTLESLARKMEACLRKLNIID